MTASSEGPAQKETKQESTNKPCSKATIDLTKLTDFEISMLIIERDACQYKVERIDELLNKIGEAKGFIDIEKKAPKDEDKPSWDPTKIKWTHEEGTKGPYEKAEAQSTDDFKNMLADLKAHDSKLTRNGLFYWLFQDGTTVGRKKRTY